MSQGERGLSGGLKVYAPTAGVVSQERTLVVGNCANKNEI